MSSPAKARTPRRAAATDPYFRIALIAAAGVTPAAAAVAGRPADRSLPRRGAVLDLGAASRLGLLLQAARRRLDDRRDDGAVRRRRSVGQDRVAADLCRDQPHGLRHHRAAL
ncbi:MAG: hypothetical protein WDN69_18740 [Aliidongia sp.]